MIWYKQINLSHKNCSSTLDVYIFTFATCLCIQVLEHLSKVNFTTPQGETFYFQGADVPAKYDLVNWQSTPEGQLKLVVIGRVDGFDLRLNESAIHWSTGANQEVKKELIEANTNI